MPAYTIDFNNNPFEGMHTKEITEICCRVVDDMFFSLNHPFSPEANALMIQRYKGLKIDFRMVASKLVERNYIRPTIVDYTILTAYKTRDEVRVQYIKDYRQFEEFPINVKGDLLEIILTAGLMVMVNKLRPGLIREFAEDVLVAHKLTLQRIKLLLREHPEADLSIEHCKTILVVGTHIWFAEDQ